MHNKVSSYNQQNDELAENGRLKSFAREVIEAMWEGDIDGSDIQELAVKHGLIFETVATAEDIAIRRDYVEIGDSWFRYTDWMKSETN